MLYIVYPSLECNKYILRAKLNVALYEEYIFRWTGIKTFFLIKHDFVKLSWVCYIFQRVSDITRPNRKIKSFAPVLVFLLLPGVLRIPLKIPSALRLRRKIKHSGFLNPLSPCSLYFLVSREEKRCCQWSQVASQRDPVQVRRTR